MKLRPKWKGYLIGVLAVACLVSGGICIQQNIQAAMLSHQFNQTSKELENDQKNLEQLEQQTGQYQQEHQEEIQKGKSNQEAYKTWKEKFDQTQQKL